MKSETGSLNAKTSKGELNLNAHSVMVYRKPGLQPFMVVASFLKETIDAAGHVVAPGYISASVDWISAWALQKIMINKKTNVSTKSNHNNEPLQEDINRARSKFQNELRTVMNPLKLIRSE